MEGDIHKHLKWVAINWLKSKVTDIVATEVKFRNTWSIADAVGLNLKRREVRVIEAKSTKADYNRDIKLHGDKTSYFYHAHYSYIMCPTDVIKPEELPYGYGLLYVDEYDNVVVVKNPIKNTARLKTLFDTTLKRTVRALTNQMLFKQVNKENKDYTDGRYIRKAEIFYISANCGKCRHVTKELIKRNITKQINCKNCGEIIDLSKSKVREITGFNKTFIDKINKLNN